MRERHGGSENVSNEASVAGGVSGALVQIGFIEGDFHVHAPARHRVRLPYRTASMPQRAGAFQSRGAATELARILESGAAAPTSIATPNTALVSGLGGVGKTQLALDYAERSWAAGKVDLLVWVTAGTRDAVVSGYARLMVELTGSAEPDAEQGADRFLAWLATTDARWLIVLDDLQQPRDLERLWPPAAPTGQVLVTTRRSDAALRGPHRRTINLDVFTPEEAHTYIRDALAEHPNLGDAIEALADTLGYLPLALAQATTYLLDRGLSCTAYLARWNDRYRQLSTLFPEPDWLPDEQRSTVATTWSLSIDHANQLEPPGLARPLLEVASVLDPNGIPTAALTSAAVTELLTATVGYQVSNEQARDGLACLQRLNIITQSIDSPHPVVRMHVLVQRAARDCFTSGRLQVLARIGADALSEIWPAGERAADLAQILRTNADILADVSGPHLWATSSRSILFRAGESLGESGLAKEARDYFQRLYIAACQYLGSEHPDTLTTLQGIGRWRGAAGDPTAAAATFEGLRADRLRVLGPDHPDTLTARRHAIGWRHASDGSDIDAAVAALKELLADTRVRD